MIKQVNVLVVGGGPAGSTAAALLARAGLRVLLLERDAFPRYHIGESLLASCQSTLKLSGAYDAVAAHGFQIKRGGVILWGDDEWVLDWRTLVDPNIWSWQVDRASYDDILLRNAARQGAEVVEEATVKRILFDRGRATAAEWTLRGDDEIHIARFDHVIDASGRKGVIAQHLDLRHGFDHQRRSQRRQRSRGLGVLRVHVSPRLHAHAGPGGSHVRALPGGRRLLLAGAEAGA